MDVRARILHAAAELLAASPSGDVSTRAVCEAAGVGPAALYRAFGDKDGLIAAVVDAAYARYLDSKRAQTPSDDPVRDLRAGWDGHVAFARDNPAFYRLMHAPGGGTPPAAAAEAQRMLVAVLERCAAAGRLRLSPEIAGQMIMSANVGLSLMLVSRPALYPEPTLSTRVREAVFAAVLTDEPTAGAADADGAEATAARLGALLRRSPSPALRDTESALLQDWLARISDTVAS